VLTVGTAIALPYAVLAAFVAAAANAAPVRPSPVAAMIGGFVVGWLSASWGAARGTGQLDALLRALPAHAGPQIAAGALAVSVVFTAGIVLVLTSLAVHAQTAADLTHTLGGGTAPGIALLVADGLLLPNAAAVAIGYLTGPGLAVGAGTSVSLAGAQVGRVPALPLLAALPHGPAPVPVRAFTVVVLLAAGATAGWWVVRGTADAAPRTVAARVVGAAGWAGILATGLVAFADGPAGPGRMAVVGASPWQVGLTLFAEVVFVGGLVAALVCWRQRVDQ
jgi:hypothetical protein